MEKKVNGVLLVLVVVLLLVVAGFVGYFIGNKANILSKNELENQSQIDEKNVQKPENTQVIETEEKTETSKYDGQKKIVANDKVHTISYNQKKIKEDEDGTIIYDVEFFINDKKIKNEEMGVYGHHTSTNIELTIKDRIILSTIRDYYNLNKEYIILTTVSENFYSFTTVCVIDEDGNILHSFSDSDGWSLFLEGDNKSLYMPKYVIENNRIIKYNVGIGNGIVEEDYFIKDGKLEKKVSDPVDVIGYGTAGK